MAAGSRLSVFAALGANLVIAVLKLVSGLAIGSSAMLAEAAHSFSDVGNQVLLLIGLQRSQAGPSDKYPFGRGKSAYFWPFLVAVLLFGVAGAYSLIEGIEKVRHPHPIGDPTVSLGVLAAAFVLEAIALTIALRQARSRADEAGIRSVGAFLRQNRDATLLTVIVEDSLALTGLPIAAASIGLSAWTGNPVWDGIGSLVIGVLLMGFALFLAWEVKDLLIGQGLVEADRRTVQRVLAEDPAVVDVHRIQSMYLSHDDVLLGVEVRLDPSLTGAETEQAVDRIEDELKEALSQLSFVFVEPGSRPDSWS